MLDSILGLIGKVIDKGRGSPGAYETVSGNVLGRSMTGKNSGSIQGGVGGTNTGTQTQNILGKNRPFPTWSPYR